VKPGRQTRQEWADFQNIPTDFFAPQRSNSERFYKKPELFLTSTVEFAILGVKYAGWASAAQPTTRALETVGCAALAHPATTYLERDPQDRREGSNDVATFVPVECGWDEEEAAACDARR
jgi:hypothetical protein